MTTDLLKAVVTLLAVMNPVGAAPIFANMVSGLPLKRQYSMALRVCAIIFGILTVSALGGSEVLSLFGLSIESFRIAGGIIVAMLGFGMLTGRHSKESEKLADDQAIQDQMFVPFAMPMVAGPGTITAVITLSVAEHHGPVPVLAIVASALASLATGASLFAILRFERYISRQVLRIITRFMGLILIAMGAQFVVDGLKASLPGLAG